MTSKFNIDNRDLLQRISCGEAVVGVDFGNLIVRELAAFRLAEMDSEPVAYMVRRHNEHDGTGALIHAEFLGRYQERGDFHYTPLYSHAQPAPMVMQSEPAIADCDPEVYEKGVSVCLVAISKETAEVICQNITAATGCKVDWHYFGGRVHIKALRVASQPAPVVPEEMTIRDACKFVQDMRLFDDVSVIVMRTWNACRAAMLQELKKVQELKQSAGVTKMCRRWRFSR